MEQLPFFFQQLTNGLILGSVYSLVAIGLTLVFGVLGVINMAHGEMAMVGAFAGLLCLQAGVPAPAVLLVAALAAGLGGLLMERLALRPLPHGVDPHIPMVSTIGVSIIIQELATKAFTAKQRPYPTPGLLGERLRLGPIQVDYLHLVILGLALALMVGLKLFISRTKLGIAIRAVAENPRTAGLMGINERLIVALVFVISSALAGVAGALVGMNFNNISPFIGVPIGFKGLAAVIFGGLGNVTGAMVAGLVIGVSEVMAVGYVASSWRDAVAFGAMILILLVRPAGIFGTVGQEKV